MRKNYKGIENKLHEQKVQDSRSLEPKAQSNAFSMYHTPKK
jgi:hypothetical protein